VLLSSISEQILLNEPAGYLPIGAEVDRHPIVGDDGDSGAEDSVWMRAGLVDPGHHIFSVRLDNHAGAGANLQLPQLVSEPVAFSDDGVNEVIEGLPLNRNYVLQTRQGIIPSRQSMTHDLETLGRK